MNERRLPLKHSTLRWKKIEAEEDPENENIRENIDLKGITITEGRLAEGRI